MIDSMIILSPTDHQAEHVDCDKDEFDDIGTIQVKIPKELDPLKPQKRIYKMIDKEIHCIEYSQDFFCFLRK